jgi:outer membrane receptor for Fe3+-dicitrate
MEYSAHKKKKETKNNVTNVHSRAEKHTKQGRELNQSGPATSVVFHISGTKTELN